jgi:hypothetical protein
MRRFVKVAAVVVAILLILGIGLTLALKAYLSGDRLKAIVVPQLEGLTGRKITVDSMSISLFKGIVASGLAVRDRDGKTVMLSVEKFVLSYKPLALLDKQLVISKIEIVSPFVQLRRDAQGGFGFAGDGTAKTGPEKERGETKAGALPVSIIADRLLVKKGRFVFSDETKALPDLSAGFDIDVTGSVGRDRSLHMDHGHVTFRELKSDLQGISLNASGTADLTMETITARVAGKVGRDPFEVSSTVKDYLSDPRVKLDVRFTSLDLDGLMGAGKGAKSPPKRTGKEVRRQGQGGGKGAEEKPPKIKAAGRITVDQAKYTGYAMKNFTADFTFIRGVVTVSPMKFSFSGGTTFKAEGAFEGKMGLVAKDTETIKKTLAGSGLATLGKGSVNRSAVSDAVAALTGIAALRDPGFDQGRFTFDIKGQVVNLNGFVSSDLFRADPGGTITFDKKLDLSVELKIAPALSKGLSGIIPGMSLLKDDKGWTILPLTIKGTTDSPKAGVDQRKLLDRGLRGKIEELFAPPPAQGKQPSGKTGPGNLLDRLFGR